MILLTSPGDERSPFTKGALIGLAITGGVIVLAAIDEFLLGPSLGRAALHFVAAPFLFPASAITYFAIVGDNATSLDFLRYIAPMSAIINALIGGITYSFAHRWKGRRRSAR